MSNKLQTSLAILALPAFALAFAPRGALGQVGHDPEHSPYHDLRATHQFTLSGGYLAGGGGRAGVGPRQGPLLGFRYSLSLGAVELTMALHGASLDRHIVDPTAPLDKRDAGVVHQSVMLADGGFNLRLTGAKTWHGFLPYVGASAGAATGGSVPQDNSGFSFTTRFEFGPHLGVRYYGPGALSLWVEGWDPMWRLRYPNSFFDTTINPTPVLTVGTDPTTEWTHNPTVLVGFSLTVRP